MEQITSLERRELEICLISSSSSCISIYRYPCSLADGIDDNLMILLIEIGGRNIESDQIHLRVRSQVRREISDEKLKCFPVNFPKKYDTIRSTEFSDWSIMRETGLREFEGTFDSSC